MKKISSAYVQTRGLFDPSVFVQQTLTYTDKLRTLCPLHRHPSQGIRRLFLGALGQEGGQLYGVVRGVDGVALQCGSEGIAEPVVDGRDRSREE